MAESIHNDPTHSAGPDMTYKSMEKDIKVIDDGSIDKDDHSDSRRMSASYALDPAAER
jgi:hypothetical protein